MGQVIKDWIAALRSGEYEQGRSKLKTSDDKYCCLGVLCVVSELESRINTNNDYEFDGHTGWLPEQLREKFSMSKEGFRIPASWLPRKYSCNYSGPFSLTDLNDQGVPFTVIADLIERHYEQDN